MPHNLPKVRTRSSAFRVGLGRLMKSGDWLGPERTPEKNVQDIQAKIRLQGREAQLLLSTRGVSDVSLTNLSPN